MEYTITVTTLNGEQVSAPVSQWVTALILSRPDEELVKLIRMVEDAQLQARTRIVQPATHVPTIPADPAEYVNKDGSPRRNKG